MRLTDVLLKLQRSDYYAELILHETTIYQCLGIA
jgi:hypothetical protein